MRTAQEFSSNTENVFGCVVSDGAGSATFGGQGASIVCRTLITELSKHFVERCQLPETEELIDWIDIARCKIKLASANRGLSMRDFAATLLIAVSNGNESVFVHIGDGGIVIQDNQSKDWIAPTWPNQGEYASTTFFVTDDEPLSTRICRIQLSIKAIAVFTDGIERLALDFTGKKPHAPFFNSMTPPLTRSKVNGRDRSLCQALQDFLNSKRVNVRTDDDKTLILAINRCHKLNS